MGFFDNIKAAFDSGGIKVNLDLPDQFTWGDQTLPATVTLTGHKAEQRRVQALRFQFLDVSPGKDSDTPNGSRVRVEHDHAGPIDLEPGQEVTLTVPAPIAILDITDVEPVPGAMGAAIGFLGNLRRPESIQNYMMYVHFDLEGAQRSKKANRQILNNAR